MCLRYVVDCWIQLPGCHDTVGGQPTQPTNPLTLWSCAFLPDSKGDLDTSAAIAQHHYLSMSICLTMSVWQPHNEVRLKVCDLKWTTVLSKVAHRVTILELCSDRSKLFFAEIPSEDRLVAGMHQFKAQKEPDSIAFNYQNLLSVPSTITHWPFYGTVPVTFVSWTTSTSHVSCVKFHSLCMEEVLHHTITHSLKICLRISEV